MPLLETRGLTAFYGDFQALFGVDLAVGEGETRRHHRRQRRRQIDVLKALAGLFRNEPGDGAASTGQPIGALPAPTSCKRGIAMVPEGRRLFPSLSVEENLLIGGLCAQGAGPVELERVYELFPILRERRHSSGARRCPAASSRWSRSAAR